MLAGIRHSVAGRTLLLVGLGVGVLILISTAVTYVLVYREIERQTVERLWEYADQRALFHQSEFDLALESHRTVKDEFIRRYALPAPDAVARFDELMDRYPDGAWRNAQEYSDVSRISNAWVHKDAVVDDEFKRLMMLYFDLSEQFARMVSQRFVNLYFLDPKGQGNMGWEDPAKVNNRRWIYETAADYDLTSLDTYYTALPGVNPGGETRWNRPVYEPGYAKWVVSCATPVSVDGKLVGIIGTDVLVEDLQRNITQTHIPGTHHSMFTAAGLLVVDAELTHRIIGPQGEYWIEREGDERLKALYALASSAGNSLLRGYDEPADLYYAIARLRNMDWYFASSLPGLHVREEAFRNARWVLWSGLASLAAMLAVLAMVLRRQVDHPLRALIEATGRIGRGEPIGPTPRSSGELGTLLNAFDRMAGEIGERDRALRAEKERFRVLTEHGSDFIALLNAQGEILYISASVEKILGHKPASLVGKNPLDLMHEDDRKAMERAFQACARVPYSHTGKLRYRLRNQQGQWRWIECGGTNLLEDPQVLAVLLNQHDITEQVAAEEELTRQRELTLQREKFASMGSLLAGVAHELNNPLSVVVGRAIMLEEEAQDPAIRTTAQRIRTAAERCARIVRTFLAMARRTGQERAWTSVEAVIDAALEMVDYSLKANGVTVIRERAAALPDLYIDPDQLHQVFTNLFVNAYQAMAEVDNRRELLVRTRVDTAQSRVIIDVIDSGAGIPESIRARIFDPYFTTKSAGTGTGVGLAVSLGIVESHGGVITVECPSVGGTHFTVMLPMAEHGHDEPASEPSDEVEVTANARRVLVVDDEIEIREMLADVLRGAGCSVDLAEDGEAALDKLARARYDAVFTDLRMPRLDGAGLYRRIESHHPGLARRVIFVSGDSLSGALPNFISTSGRPILEKPFTPAQVLQALARVATD